MKPAILEQTRSAGFNIHRTFTYNVFPLPLIPSSKRNRPAKPSRQRHEKRGEAASPGIRLVGLCVRFSLPSTLLTHPAAFHAF